MQIQWKGILLLSCAVVIQFILELTIGRIFTAPSVIPLLLVYLTFNHGDSWAIDGAFWSGLSIDMLMHQPIGASSLAFLCGMYTVRVLKRQSASETRIFFLIAVGIAVGVSDIVFILAASRPFAVGVLMTLFEIIPRVLLSLLAGITILTLGSKMKFGTTSQKVKLQ